MLLGRIESPHRVDDLLGRRGSARHATSAISQNKELAASKRESASSIFPGGSGCFSSNRNFHNESRAWLTYQG